MFVTLNLSSSHLTVLVGFVLPLACYVVLWRGVLFKTQKTKAPLDMVF